MTLVAGIDIGNATTEIVLVDPARPDVVLAHVSARTRGAKGSSTSIRGAADLVRRLQRGGHDIGEIAVSSLRPVLTSTTHIEGEPPPSGPIQLVVQGSSTPANPGFGVGRAVVMTEGGAEQVSGSVVAIVPRSLRFDRAALLIGQLVRSGADVRAVILEADEAVLLANRLDVRVPVVDEVDLVGADRWGTVGVEVVARGGVLAHLADPLRLSAVFQVSTAEPAVASIVSRVGDVSSAVVAAVPPRHHESPRRESTRYDPMRVADDRFGVDVQELVRRAHCEILDVRPGAYAIATLDTSSPVDPSVELTQLLDLPAHRVASETEAARAGALTTPGSTHTGVVIDLGAGTIDVIGASGTRVLAGGGHLTTAAIAMALGIPSGLAEWIKRGPAVWVDGPFKTVAENGDRGFLDGPAPAAHVGRLVAEGPSGLIPFTTPLHVTQWRALRIAAKQASLGRSIGRCRDLLPPSGTAVVVGGPALDTELLMAVRGHLPDRLMVGRGDVAGALGPRYAVAYGLAYLFATG